MIGATCPSPRGSHPFFFSSSSSSPPNRRSPRTPPPIAAAFRRPKMAAAGPKEKAVEAIASVQLLPRLVVFDLDYTLWPFYCEFRSGNETPRLYPEVEGILYALKEKGIGLAIASRTPTPNVAKAFIGKLGIQSMLAAQEIFPSWTDKTEHFNRIHATTGLPYNSMLFFDDENRNIRAVSKMGVTSILVDDGMNIAALTEGLRRFAMNSPGSSARNNQKRK